MGRISAQSFCLEEKVSLKNSLDTENKPCYSSATVGDRHRLTNGDQKMSTLTKCHRQWATRPAEERFLNLCEMQSHFANLRNSCAERTLPLKSLEFRPSGENGDDLELFSGRGPAETNHWSFGQICSAISTPAEYIRRLPAPLAAQNLNYGLQYSRNDIESKFMLQNRSRDGLIPLVRAATGPNYGRIWNSTVLDVLTSHFGDGISGDFRVPGIFGKSLTQVTKDNTTLFASDQDMFIFLADEHHRITVKNRRNGQNGSLARGFFLWNSEVGAATLGIATFLFDFVCSNRIVWGAEEYSEIKIRHSKSANYRWDSEVFPALDRMAQSSVRPIENKIAAAQAKMIGKGDPDAVINFLTNRFNKKTALGLNRVHIEEENRPIETIWDAVTAGTAFARTIEHQNDRVEFERKSSALLDLVD